MNLFTKLTSAGSVVLLWHVLTFLICGTGLLLEKALRQGNPHVRSSLLRITLMLALAIPAACVIWNMLPPLPASALPLSEKPAQVAGSQALPAQPLWNQIAVWRPVLAGMEQDRFDASGKQGASLSQMIEAALPVASLLISLYLLARLALAFLRGASLRRQGKPLAEAHCGIIAASMGVPTPQVLKVSGLESPVLVGFLKPAILCPDGLHERDEVYRHELTHLKRHDLWWRLLAGVATILMPLQPGFWLLKGAMERADEDVCDDMVLVLGASRPAYAKLLLNVAETQRHPDLELSLSMAAFRSQLERRLQRLLDTTRPLARRTSLPSLGLCLPPLFAVGILMAAISLDAERPVLGADANAADLPMPAKDPGAVALLQRVLDTYKNASSFSCEGQYETDLQTAMPVKLAGTFAILFSRPDEIRVDWTDTQFGGTVVTSSVFTQDSIPYFYMGALHRWAPQKNLELALGAAGGVSHGISYAIPSLLRGKAGYLTFTSLKAPQDAVVDGTKCLILSGTAGRSGGDMEIAIDPSSFAIRRIKTTKLIRPAALAQEKEAKKARAEFAKSNPALAASLPNPASQPDFTSVAVTTYKNPVFGKEFKAADFVYPVPADARKVENLFDLTGLFSAPKP